MVATRVEAVDDGYIRESLWVICADVVNCVLVTPLGDVYFQRLCRVGWGIAPMGGAKRAPLILANLELCGSIWRSNDSLQHTKDLSTDEVF